MFNLNRMWGKMITINAVPAYSNQNTMNYQADVILSAKLHGTTQLLGELKKVKDPQEQTRASRLLVSIFEIVGVKDAYLKGNIAVVEKLQDSPWESISPAVEAKICEAFAAAGGNLQ
jgi:hypothetical protein